MINSIWRHIRLLIHKKSLRTHQVTPFFIIGAGRSGTTLLRVILERSQQVAIPPESGGSLPKALDYFLTQKKEGVIDDIIAIYELDKDWINWGLQKKSLVDSYHSDVNFGNIISHIYSSYAESKNCKVWGDKNPYMTFFIPEILTVFPNAKFIHLIRDGRDVAYSWFKKLDKYQTIEDAAKRWNWSLKEIERYKPLLGNNLLNVKYEDLATQPTDHIKEICDFINIKFDSQILESSETDLGNDLNQAHLKKSKTSIGVDSIGKWKENLKPEELRRIMPIISGRLKKYGYE